MEINASTRAAVMTGPRQTELRALPIPEVPPDAGLLRIEGKGICGSDWGMYLDGSLGDRILGHEMVGTVDKIGDIARTRWGVKEGDRIALEEYLPCGHCEYCRSGEFRSCLETDTRLPGFIRYGSTPVARAPGLWGGYSEFAYMHPRSVIHRVPDGVPTHIATMALPIGNGFQWAFLDGGAAPGKTVVVMGPGQQGLGCVIASAVAGADQIIVTGLRKDEARLDVARRLGATHTIVADEEDVGQAVAHITGGRRADIVIDATGAGPAIVNPTLQLLRKRGTLVVPTRKGAPVPAFDLDFVVNRQIVLRGTRGHSFEAVELALGIMKSGRFPLELMSSHIVGLAGVDHALRMVGGDTQERCIHVTVDPRL